MSGALWLEILASIIGLALLCAVVVYVISKFRSIWMNPGTAIGEQTVLSDGTPALVLRYLDGTIHFPDGGGIGGVYEGMLSLTLTPTTLRVRSNMFDDNANPQGSVYPLQIVRFEESGKPDQSIGRILIQSTFPQGRVEIKLHPDMIRACKQWLNAADRVGE